LSALLALPPSLLAALGRMALPAVVPSLLVAAPTDWSLLGMLPPPREAAFFSSQMLAQ
jgi:hypothetical protein